MKRTGLGDRHQDPRFIRETFAAISRRYDLANHILSCGLDFVWRDRVARLVRSGRPQRILDVATGSGDLAAAIRKACPRAQVVGADFCEAMLLESRRKGSWPLVVTDGMALPFRSAVFDAVTVAFGLRNMADRAGALREMHRVLRREGRLVVLDFSLPASGVGRSVYRVYLHELLPRIAGIVTGNGEAYKYLGESIESFPRNRAMTSLLESCGFRDARVRPLSFGVVSLYSATAR